ncbi:uncharacterized protein A4U43_C06F9620, partial [Asparagus officinalis]
MSGILLKRVDTGEQSVLEVKGLFYGIGHPPNNQLLEGQVELDSSDYMLVKEGTAKTSVEDVFAAGDVQPVREEEKKELSDKDVQMGFDITRTKHKGHYALRKLYHESPRLICVLYTAPTCGPCRTLKPILGK